MNALQINISFPALGETANSPAVTSTVAAMHETGELSISAGSLTNDELHCAKMHYALFLMQQNRESEAGLLIDTINYESELDPPLLHSAWLWLARMEIYLRKRDYSMAISAAENSLRRLESIEVKKGEDFFAILGSILYNLAFVHHQTNEDSRAAKELTQAQKIFERMAKRNGERFSEMLLYAVEASTLIIKSKVKQMNVLAHYQADTALYAQMVENGATEAIEKLVESLKNEGDIMLQMGNSRDATKYYTKALRYQKKISDKMGLRELELSICLARALMRLINRREAAEQLLNSLLPLSRRLGAIAQEQEIEELMKNRTKTNSIMTLLKGIFVVMAIVTTSLSVNAQLIVGHRGSVWGVENTRAAFINGATAGAWGLECDIHTSKDGVFVICHDSDLKRIGGGNIGIDTTNIAQLVNAPILQTRSGKAYVGNLMTLGDYIDLCKSYNVVPVIEIKWSKDIYSNDTRACYDGIPALMQLIADKKMTDKVVIISFMKGVMEHLHKNYPGVKYQMLISKDWEKWVDWCKERKMDIDAAHTCITEEMVKAFHKAGVKVNAWTVDDPAIFKRLQQWGVDYITTNKLFPNP